MNDDFDTSPRPNRLKACRFSESKMRPEAGSGYGRRNAPTFSTAR